MQTTEAKCNCQRCGQPIAYPSERENTEATCPHCGKVTTLATPQIRAISAPAESTKPKDPLGNLILAGYLTAIVLPPIGFLIGLILLARARPARGLAIMLLSSFIGILIAARLNLW